jgi:glycopeptide antibiotics resistance protein
MTAAGIAYLGVVLWLTLGPAPWAGPDIAEIPLGVLNAATWFSPITWTTGSSVEFALNVMMFVPVGVLAALLLSGRTRIVLPVGFTVLIEVAQILLPERVSDPRDLVANSVGAFAGLVITRIVAGQVRIPAGGPGAVVSSPN